MVEKDKNSKWRIILAIALSFIIIMTFQIFYAPKDQPQQKTQPETKPQADAVKSPKVDEKLSSSKGSIFKETPKETPKKEAGKPGIANLSGEKIIPEKIIEKQTNLYKLEFSTKGAILKSIKFKNFLDKDKKEIELTPIIEPNASPLLYQIENLNLGPDYVYTEGKDGSLIFTQEDANIKVDKQFVLNPDQFDIKVNITITNKTTKEVSSKDSFKWAKSAGPFLVPEKRSSYDEEFNVSFYDRQLKSEEKFSSEVVEKTANIDWIALDNRYFFISIIPEKPGTYAFKLVDNKPAYDEEITLYSPVSISPLSSLKKSYTVYIGPKDERILKTYNANLEAITERGFAPITLIGKGIKWLLFWINGLINNFGITIIILSLIFKILLHPLSKKSMESARKMQVLGPQIQAIKEKHGSNKQEMNQKIWELYKREKINPASGCLPMLLQMPFFFALYGVLPYVIELKNVNFFWIHDLSSPDTIFYIEAFKNIPLMPYQFNVLPILLTIFSFIQTKVSQGGVAATGQGKMMEYLMPIMFLFIFWTMPSGLVLYWLMQTVFTILHQYYVNSRPPKNKKSDGKNNSKKKLSKKAA